jgi:hypothetical protein
MPALNSVFHIFHFCFSRPSESDESPTQIRDPSFGSVALSVVSGNNVVEVRQVFSSWAKQTIRIRENSNAVELEFSVGPVPVDGVSGREVISKFRSSLRTGPDGANKV